MLIPGPKTPHRSAPAKTVRGTARRGARHVGASSGSRWSSSPGLILAPLATVAAVDGVGADRAAGIGPGAAARNVEGQARRRGGGPLIAAEAVASGRGYGINRGATPDASPAEAGRLAGRRAALLNVPCRCTDSATAETELGGAAPGHQSHGGASLAEDKNADVPRRPARGRDPMQPHNGTSQTLARPSRALRRCAPPSKATIRAGTC
jgi:hypothetical protein